MSNVPKLRFPEFSGEWEVKRLGSVVYPDLQPVNKPDTSYTRLRVRSHGKGTFYEQVENPNTIDMETLYEVKEDQLLVNITFAWEHAICVTNQEDSGKLVSHRFPTYSFNEGNNPIFYKHYILRPKFKYQLKIASPGGAGRNRVLNKSEFLNIIMPKPSLPEQTKIANFLTLFDCKIAKQAEKVSSLEEYKKGLMQKIFSRELRFKDHDGKDYPEWKHKKFGEIFDFYPTYSHSRAMLNMSAGSIKYIHYGDIHTKYPIILDVQNTHIPYINDTIAASSIIQDSFCKNGDLVIADASEDYEAIGKAIVVKNVRNDKIISGLHTILARDEKGFTVDSFRGYMLASDEVRKKIKISAVGAKVLGISKTNLLNIELKLPCLPEQTKIANFLTLFDRKIEKEKEKLEALREQKKGLLQQMFV